MPVSTALSHKPTVTHLTQEGTAVVKSSDGSAVDPRLHFASTYSISYGRFALSPPKAYRPYAASVALTTVANPILAPTADVKQPTAFTTNEKPFIPYHASIDRFATSSYVFSWRDFSLIVLDLVKNPLKNIQVNQSFNISLERRKSHRKIIAMQS